MLIVATPARAQQRLAVNHLGEQRIGPALAAAVRTETANLKVNRHKILFVTGPSPCAGSIVVSMVITQGETFLSSAVMVVDGSDVGVVAKQIATNLAAHLKPHGL